MTAPPHPPQKRERPHSPHSPYPPNSGARADTQPLRLRADCVAKVQNCPVINLNQSTTGDLCSLNRVTEVAREFIVTR
jgi:hypothetical protein